MQIRRGISRMAWVVMLIWAAVVFGIAGFVVFASGIDAAPYVLGGAFLLWIGPVILIFGIGKTFSWVFDGFREDSKKNPHWDEWNERSAPGTRDLRFVEPRQFCDVKPVRSLNEPREQKIWNP